MTTKYFMIAGILLLSACTDTDTQIREITEPVTRAPYDLTPYPIPIEQIEASTGFISPYFVADGNAHLSYELTLSNFNRASFELISIELVEPDGQVLMSFDANYLDAHFYREGQRPKTGNRILEGNQYGTANLWLSLEPENIPKEFFHRLNFNIKLSEDRTRDISIDVARTEFPKETTLILSPPVPPGVWFYSMESHRDTRILTEGRASYAQRYALDLAMANEDGTFVDGPIDTLDSYPMCNLPILAAAGGTVIAIQDGVGDNNPETGERPERINKDTLVGNSVLIDIGDGLNALYAHLIPGSLKVKVGDKVKTGDEVGRLGNSGNSDGAHLHFHIETQSGLARPVAGEGVPYYFKKYQLLDIYSDADLETVFTDNKMLPFKNPPIEKENSLPVGNGIIKF